MYTDLNRYSAPWFIAFRMGMGLRGVRIDRDSDGAVSRINGRPVATDSDMIHELELALMVGN